MHSMAEIITEKQISHVDIQKISRTRRFLFLYVSDLSRKRFLTDEVSRSILSKVIKECKQRWSFHIDAMVMLPDHLHAIWTLPSGDKEYSKRWGWIKKEFTKRYLAAGHSGGLISLDSQKQRRKGIWQERFWEHTIQDEDDFEKHFDYIHYNPIKHNLVENAVDWPWSSFHRWVKKGVYPE